MFKVIQTTINIIVLFLLGGLAVTWCSKEKIIPLAEVKKKIHVSGSESAAPSPSSHPAPKSNISGNRTTARQTHVSGKKL